jgi:hypothetical protein
MAMGRPEARGGDVIAHGSSRTSRWLRERRLRIALWIAAAEGLLIIIHAIGRWPAIIVAGAILVAYLLGGRTIKSDTGYQIMWIVAASQALVALVPLIWWFITRVIAIIIVAALAVVALVFLFSDRRTAARS